MKTFLKFWFTFIFSFCLVSSAPNWEVEVEILINQVGYYTNSEKIAVIKGDLEVKSFRIIDLENEERMLTGKLEAPRKSPYSGVTTWKADFTELKKPGRYSLIIDGQKPSGIINIGDEVYTELSKALVKALYFQRASIPLKEKYAGKWKRPLGHPDDKVYIHPSAASENRPVDFIISSPKGWYDAGDYNKYIVNSSFSTSMILSLYEDFPEIVKNQSLNIPESENQVPDILDEMLWNLRWMITMQDPEDGGVYHKLTTANFEPFEMPDKVNSKRYVVQKSTNAALDFSAFMSQASRVFRDYEEHFPGLADSCEVASNKAWAWAVKNPDQVYDQRDLNVKYTPEINTGAYGGRDVSDEFFWAACELMITSPNEEYRKYIVEYLENFKTDEMSLPSWGNVETLGVLTLLRHAKDRHINSLSDFSGLKEKILSFSDQLISGSSENTYHSIMGSKKSDFKWGSNSVACEQALLLIEAYKLTLNKKYLQYALRNVDYLLGINATGYSFVTGFGKKTPMHIHHRVSESDGVKEPIPGLLVGGPNPSQQDRCTYPSNAADESFIDDVCSFASNEICLDWNAPFIYVMYTLESLKVEVGYSRI